MIATTLRSKLADALAILNAILDALNALQAAMLNLLTAAMSALTDAEAALTAAEDALAAAEDALAPHKPLWMHSRLSLRILKHVCLLTLTSCWHASWSCTRR